MVTPYGDLSFFYSSQVNVRPVTQVEVGPLLRKEPKGKRDTTNKTVLFIFLLFV